MLKNKQILLEKYISVAVKKALKEQEIQRQKAEKSLYLVYRFPGLKKIMEDLMSPSFSHYIKNINITAPKPTTFKIELINNQEFTIYYDDIVGLVDGLVESYQGRYGIITGYMTENNQ